jgi:hypothetical protein
MYCRWSVTSAALDYTSPASLRSELQPPDYATTITQVRLTPARPSNAMARLSISGSLTFLTCFGPTAGLLQLCVNQAHTAAACVPHALDGRLISQKLGAHKFLACCLQEFPRAGSRSTPVHPAADFVWKDYAPSAFRYGAAQLPQAA